MKIYERQDQLPLGYYPVDGCRVLIGDCIEQMRQLPAQSVHCCVTSPPYYGLRDYGVDGQIGLEPTPEEFIQKLVAVFREVRRVLRDDGTLWVNIGDSYARRGGTDKNISSTGKVGNTLKTLDHLPDRKQQPPAGTKEKDLLGIPWMLAFALREDGWYLRQDIIWNKPNAMPESVRDRCTKAHEYMFLLSKSKRYYFDHEAIKEPAASNRTIGTGVGWNTTSKNDHRDNRADRTRSRRDSFKREGSKREQQIPGQNYGTHRNEREESAWDLSTRNKRSVWNVATRGYKEAHFATFPPALIEPCILAGSPVGGTVLDPFGGSGTTAGVALANGRNAILCELNNEYAELMPSRIKSIYSDAA
ncbi:DNA-methyltransferase [Shewanella fodinae]|uniref:DNA-methyltransferase n=2 Tax=Shewanella fodinae TaxID=552357 RepID=UPI00167451F3|nr:site-specific DNA-methyltransferase [Shewanella fodinae]MCL2905179.1 site-specific DNA-methyltransferase [Shewanella fodinae]GGY87973.1 methyltransferase [Shewanella fodinae]